MIEYTFNIPPGRGVRRIRGSFTVTITYVDAPTYTTHVPPIIYKGSYAEGSLYVSFD